MKTGVGNDIFWPEIGSGFGEPEGAPPLLGVTPGMQLPQDMKGC